MRPIKSTVSPALALTRDIFSSIFDNKENRWAEKLQSWKKRFRRLRGKPRMIQVLRDNYLLECPLKYLGRDLHNFADDREGS